MITNKEKLANMPNEELAEFLSKQDCKFCIFYDIDCDWECEKGILQWLNKESEE